MGRQPKAYEIPPSQYCGISSRFAHSSLYERAKRIAKEQGMSIHELVELALKRYVFDAQERMK